MVSGATPWFVNISRKISNAISFNTLARWLYGKILENMNFSCLLQQLLDQPDEDIPVVSVWAKENANLNTNIMN